MASYIENALIENERVIHSGRISLWSMAHLLLLGVLLLPVVVGLIVLLVVYVRYQSTELAITNRRIIAKFGFISRRTIELNLGKIEGIEVSQTVLGRIFDYGSLTMSGVGSLQEPIHGIARPLEFRRAFMTAMEDHA
ncbi:MAG TPA: PH domain-containing protein [Stenotrophobium sp.]|nr:PH domain-containing protein [Stenotrophobium sp.]